MAPEPVPVVLNRGGGSAMAAGDGLSSAVDTAFRKAGVSVAVTLVDGEGLTAAVKRASGRSLVIVGGGDGTLGCAADVLAGSTAALGILPLGTRNNLARALDIPFDLDGAARVIARGKRRRIDVARVNGRTFINNASIGIYPAMVRLRDAEQDRHAVPKWLAALPASVAALKRMRHHRLRLRSADDAKEVVTPILFVGNNHYSLDAGNVGARDTLTDGTLSVFAVASRHRLALIGFALRTLAGRADMESDFVALGETPVLDVTGASRAIDVALDGETVRLAMPLHFESVPRALTVIAA